MQEFYNHKFQFNESVYSAPEKVLDWVTRNWDVKNDNLWWGQGWQQILWYAPQSIHSISSWRSNIQPTDLEHVSKTVDQAFSAQIRECVSTYRFKKSNGSYVNVEDTILIAYTGIEPVYLTGIMQIASSVETKFSAEKNSFISLTLEASGSGHSHSDLTRMSLYTLRTFPKFLPANRTISPAGRSLLNTYIPMIWRYAKKHIKSLKSLLY